MPEEMIRDRHAAPRAQHQHIDEFTHVMRRFLSREREKADQQLTGIEADTTDNTKTADDRAVTMR